MCSTRVIKRVTVHEYAPFVEAGSYVLWCAANRSWNPPLLPSSTSTWIAWLSVLGSVCYLIGSLQAPERLANEMAVGIGLAWLAPGWPMLFVGFFLGSLAGRMSIRTPRV